MYIAIQRDTLKKSVNKWKWNSKKCSGNAQENKKMKTRNKRQNNQKTPKTKTTKICINRWMVQQSVIIHNMDYYSTIKKNRLLICLGWISRQFCWVKKSQSEGTACILHHSIPLCNILDMTIKGIENRLTFSYHPDTNRGSIYVLPSNICFTQQRFWKNSLVIVLYSIPINTCAKLAREE